MIPPNGFGALFVFNLGYYFIFIVEALLLFLPILAFLYWMQWVFGKRV